MALFAEKYYKGSDKALVIQKLAQIASKIGCTTDELDTVIFAESAWNPAAVNTASGAYGLIQWLNSTALDIFKVTAKSIGALPAIKQLDYVETYFLVNMKRLKQTKLSDKYELYLVVFHPAAVGKPDNYIILDAAKSLKGYNSNAGLDANGNKQITKGEVKLWFDKQIKKKALLKA